MTKCPRCGENYTKETYGPCPGCNQDLRDWANRSAGLRAVLDAMWPGMMDPRND